MQPANNRIAIVGGGAAGLSFASSLKDKGYANVVVFEKEGQVGGKCRSVTLEGRAYELGAVLGTRDYSATLGLMRKVGVKEFHFPKVKRKADISREKEGWISMERLIGGYFAPKEVPLTLAQAAKYFKLAKKWPRVFRPGMEGVEEELLDPFSAWMAKYRMELFGKMVAIPFTTFGYGYFDEIPSAYVLKYMQPAIVKSLVNQNLFFHWENGVQDLWKRLAATLDVRLGEHIREIRRKGRILISTDTGRYEFDSLVLACPLDETLGLLDASEGEKLLFSRILHYDYFTFIARIEGLSPPAGINPRNFTREGMGGTMIWDNRWPGIPLHTFYILGDGKLGENDILAKLERDVFSLGGKLLSIEAKARWKYFPHVDTNTMSSGYYEKLEGMQGERGTYYTGELLSFSTLEHSARYSCELAERFF